MRKVFEIQTIRNCTPVGLHTFRECLHNVEAFPCSPLASRLPTQWNLSGLG